MTPSALRGLYLPRQRLRSQYFQKPVLNLVWTRILARTKALLPSQARLLAHAKDSLHHRPTIPYHRPQVRVPEIRLDKPGMWEEPIQPIRYSGGGSGGHFGVANTQHGERMPEDRRLCYNLLLLLWGEIEFSFGQATAMVQRSLVKKPPAHDLISAGARPLIMAHFEATRLC